VIFLLFWLGVMLAGAVFCFRQERASRARYEAEKREIDQRYRKIDRDATWDRALNRAATNKSTGVGWTGYRARRKL
jgi:hypothetical protein